MLSGMSLEMRGRTPGSRHHSPKRTPQRSSIQQALRNGRPRSNDDLCSVMQRDFTYSWACLVGDGEYCQRDVLRDAREAAGQLIVCQVQLLQRSAAQQALRNGSLNLIVRQVQLVQLPLRAQQRTGELPIQPIETKVEVLQVRQALQHRRDIILQAALDECNKWLAGVGRDVLPPAMMGFPFLHPDT